MKITLDVQDYKLDFFLDLIRKYQDFIKIENDNTVFYETDGTPISESAYIESVLTSAKAPKEEHISTQSLMAELGI